MSDKKRFHANGAGQYFNHGSDARLLGLPITSCRYEADWQAIPWRMGWLHCDRNYGVDAKWPIKPLPLVGRN